MSATPNLTIGVVPVQQQGFSWSLTAGVEPAYHSITVPNGLSRRLEGVQNPTTIRLEADGGLDGTLKPTTLEFKNVWLLEPKKVDDYHVSWTLADNRFSLRGKLLYCSYNKTRAKNERRAGAAQATGTPAELRQDFDLFAAGRYLPWSVQADGKPWNVAQIIDLELAKLNIPYRRCGNIQQVYTVENVQMDGIDIFSALRSLLAMGRLEMSIDREGQVYVYSIDYWNKTDFDTLFDMQKYRKVSGQKMYYQDRSRIRPKNINVSFEKKIETWVCNSSSDSALWEADRTPLPLTEYLPVWTQEDILMRRVVGCENVISIPYPIIINGTEYKTGEWVQMWKYLAAIGITDAEVRTMWFSNALQITYATKLDLAEGLVSEKNQQVAANVVSAIKAHYRQVFRIDPYVMDQIESWDCRRCGVIDTYSHFSPPSPLFADYTIIPHARNPLVAKRTAGWASETYVWKTNTRDPYRINATAGTVTMVSQPLGIFRVSYPSTAFSALKDIVPFAVLNPLTRTINQANGSVGVGVLLPQNLEIDPDFTLNTIISVIWATDPATKTYFGPNKYYTEFFDFSAQNGKGPDINYQSRMEYARFALRELDAQGKTKNANGDPVNLGILNSIAKTEAAKIAHQYRDFPFGGCQMAGFVDFPVQANLSEVRFTFAPNRGAVTVFGFKPVVGPTNEQKLTQDAINFLHRHVSRSDAKNESGGGF